jgi:hypothetical protein
MNKKMIKLCLSVVIGAGAFFSCSDELGLSNRSDLSIDEPGKSTSKVADTTSIPFSVTSFGFPELNSIDTIVGNYIYCVISDSIPYSSLNKDLVNRYTVTNDVTDAFWLNYHWYSPTKQDTMVNFFLNNGTRNYIPMDFRIEGLPPFYKKHYTVCLSYETNFEFTRSLNYSPIKKGSNVSIVVYGMFGIPVTDYSITLVNTSTAERFLIETGVTMSSDLYSLKFKLPTTLPVGIYSVNISRGTVEKQVPGKIKIIN